jgi:hypothetical protein
MSTPSSTTRPTAGRLFRTTTQLGATFLLMVHLCGAPALAQETPDKKPATPPAPQKPAEKKSEVSTVAAADYLVQVGKHVMWKSQVTKMHPELAKSAKPLSKKEGTDYLVQVGKTSVLASTLRRVEGTKSTRPAPHDTACKDYLVQANKKTVWASEIGAPCPAGPHKGEQKPLCCVASLEKEKDLKPCCKDAQGK